MTALRHPDVAAIAVALSAARTELYARPLTHIWNAADAGLAALVEQRDGWKEASDENLRLAGRIESERDKILDENAALVAENERLRNEPRYKHEWDEQVKALAAQVATLRELVTKWKAVPWVERGVAGDRFMYRVCAALAATAPNRTLPSKT